ncbi:hypothetical protein EV426DRAFT_721091 [Tirmania nivea]|nr:hypothetical protein EV426DRAFT_721091 [Tirmania nivea]
MSVRTCRSKINTVGLDGRLGDRSRSTHSFVTRQVSACRELHEQQPIGDHSDAAITNRRDDRPEDTNTSEHPHGRDAQFYHIHRLTKIVESQPPWVIDAIERHRDRLFPAPPANAELCPSTSGVYRSGNPHSATPNNRRRLYRSTDLRYAEVAIQVTLTGALSRGRSISPAKGIESGEERKRGPTGHHREILFEELRNGKNLQPPKERVKLPDARDKSAIAVMEEYSEGDVWERQNCDAVRTHRRHARCHARSTTKCKSWNHAKVD